MSGVAISGHLERFSPGQNGSEVGRPEGLSKAIGRPTSEPFWPGENLSEWPEIATPLGFWPKFLENHKAQNLRKFSGGLVFVFCKQLYNRLQGYFQSFCMERPPFRTSIVGRCSL